MRVVKVFVRLLQKIQQFAGNQNDIAAGQVACINLILIVGWAAAKFNCCEQVGVVPK